MIKVLSIKLYYGKAEIETSQAYSRSSYKRGPVSDQEKQFLTIAAEIVAQIIF